MVKAVGCVDNTMTTSYYGCMNTKRRWTDKHLEIAVSNNQTMAGTLRDLGLSVSPGNYRSINKHIKRLELDTTHWTGLGHLKGKEHLHKKSRSLKEILVKDSDYVGISRLKTRLLRAGLLKKVCIQCGMGDEWNGEKLVLQIEHRNGVYNDHRLSNLGLICPNCHSQTKTYRGRNKKGPSSNR